jgi:hypothetical protein
MMVLGINYQISTIFRSPYLIEVKYHRELSPLIVVKSVKMSFVKTSFGIHGIMKFLVQDSHKTGSVEVIYKVIDDLKKLLYHSDIGTFIDPLNVIAPNFSFDVFVKMFTNCGFF